MAKSKINLPTCAQGVLSVGGLALAAFIGFKLYQSYQKSKELESQTTENSNADAEAQKLVKKGIKPTLNGAQLSTMVNGIKQAFLEYDQLTRAHFQPLVREFVKLGNDLDMLNLMKVYGIQTIDFPFTKFTVDDFTGNLTQSVKRFSNAEELNAINNVLARKKIIYRF